MTARLSTKEQPLTSAANCKVMWPLVVGMETSRDVNFQPYEGLLYFVVGELRTEKKRTFVCYFWVARTQWNFRPSKFLEIEYSVSQLQKIKYTFHEANCLLWPYYLELWKKYYKTLVILGENSKNVTCRLGWPFIVFRNLSLIYIKIG